MDGALNAAVAVELVDCVMVGNVQLVEFETGMNSNFVEPSCL
jgi:hypothetical protein